MTRAVVIGASGQDGSYLTRTLLKCGIEVHATTRGQDLPPDSGLFRLGIANSIHVHRMDTGHQRSVIDLFEKLSPNLVFNLGGQTSVSESFANPSDTFRSIGIATVHVLEALRLVAPEARFYNAGSSECFGDTGGVPATVETPLRPLSPYAAAKSAASLLVKTYRESYGLFCVTGYLFNHESGLRPERFVSSKIVRTAARIAAGSSEGLSLGDLSIKRDWGWAPEFVDAMVAMLDQERPADHVIATGHCMSIEQFTQYAFEEFGLDWRDYVSFDAGLARPNELKVSIGDPSLAERALGWKAQTYGQALVSKLCSQVRD